MAESGTAISAPSADTARQAVEFGASMREMRRAHNLELADVAAILKIRQIYLQAIEDGRFNALPGRTYATGFIRAYADYLGLDIGEVMRRYRDITGDQPAQTALVPPSPVVEARLPTGFILLVAAILALTVYGGWYYLTIDGRDPVEVVSSLPDRLAEMVGLNGSNDVPPAGDKTVAASPDTGQSVKEPSASSPAESADPAPPASESAAAPDVKSPSDSMPSPVPESSPPVSAAVSTADSTVDTPADSQAASPIQQVATPVPETGQAPVATVTVPSLNPVNDTPSPSDAQTATGTSSERTDTPPSPVSARAATEPASNAVGENSAPEAASALPASTSPPEAPTAAVSDPSTSGSAAASAETTGQRRRVVLRASAITWVELRDRDGKRLYSGLMKRGETYPVPSGRGVILETGNAGGLDILVDGTPIAPLGPQGAVRRNVVLEPDALLALNPGQR